MASSIHSTNLGRSDRPVRDTNEGKITLAVVLMFDLVGLVVLASGPLAVVSATETIDANGIAIILQSCNPTCLDTWKFGFQPYNFWTLPKAGMGVGLGQGAGVFFANGTMINVWCVGGNEVVIQHSGGYPLGKPIWNYTVQAPCENP